MKKTCLLGISMIVFSVSGKAQSLGTSATNNWNNIQYAGFYHSKADSGTNSPIIDGNYWWGFSSPSTGNYNSDPNKPSTRFNAQIAMLAGSYPAQMYVRSTNADGHSPWSKVILADGPQKINGGLHLALANGGNLRIGELNDKGNINVPLGDVTAQYNIDFSGYRDINTDQIGARIAALRFNIYQPEKAFVQNTGLVFYTNPYGINAGTSDLIERMRITPAGNIGIGIEDPTCKLEVNGIIRAKEVRIEAIPWPDFVFSRNYNLLSLSDVESHIIKHNHLPNIPSEAEIKENGIDIGEMQAKLLQKIEELTLYMIKLDKENQELKEENKAIKTAIGITE